MARNLPLICLGAIAAHRPDGWRVLRPWNGDCFVHIDVDGLIPAVAPDTSPEKREELEDALSAFFLATQARGKHCQVEHYRRASGVDYFFAYLDDYADTYVTLDNDGAFDRRDERRAFELVVVYDRDHGTLEMYARGGKKVYVPLQQIFCRVILGAEIGEENRDSHPYELNALLDSGFQFPTEPADGIDSVRIWPNSSNQAAHWSAE